MVSAASLTSIMICGAGHSGSTLLGMILGSHSQVFYMGEGAKARYLHDETRPLRKRVCKLCGPGCPVWSTFAWDRSAGLHGQVGDHVSRDFIVDSTKDEAWILARSAEARSAGGRAVLILLVRDGRAVVNSRLRKYPERDPAGQIRDWVDKIESSRALFDGFQGPKLMVRYEQLVSATEVALRKICAVIGLEYEAAMSSFADTDHHLLGGNSGTQYIAARARFEDPASAFVQLGDRTRGYYEEHSGDIELDLRWRQELVPDHLALFQQLAGATNAEFEWDAPAVAVAQDAVP